MLLFCYIPLRFTLLFIFSAAKAPYLARFRVRRCGIKQLESLAMAVSEKEEEEPSKELMNVGTGVEMWQAAIFKVHTHYYYYCNYGCHFKL